MKFLYTATATFDKMCNKDDMSWERYIEWSKLRHLTELVSPDEMMNKTLVEPEYGNADDWNYIHTDGDYIKGFFTTLDYVLKKMTTKDKFNLLMIVFKPDQCCREINVDGYEFVGYELFDKGSGISALTNCGGFDETFLPADLNDKGLIDDFEKAYDIKKRLLENNPNEPHAKTDVIAVWRHKTIGR